MPALLREPPLPRFRPDLHDPRTARLVGRALGIAFTVCFLTGLWSHWNQHPPSWLDVPASPVWLYRVTQGLHVATGLASVPLLLAKLWVVYPRLFAWPPARSVAQAVERLTIGVLVASAVFELVTGVTNIAQWYPWPFNFTATHYAVAWIAIGSVALHVAVKLPLGREKSPDPGRRRFLAGTFGAVGVITLLTVGQTVRPLRKLAVLAPRRPDVGPQGLPVNRTAGQAKVQVPAAYRLTVRGPRSTAYTLDELRAMPQHTAALPIACVEGWSAGAVWTGVRLRDLTAAAGIPADAVIRVVSLEQAGAYRTSEVRPSQAQHPDTLVALALHGEPLALDHGYPARLIAPDRPGVLQTKWLTRIEVA